MFAVVPAVVAQSPLQTVLWGANGGATGGAIYFDLDAEAPLSVSLLQLHLTGWSSGTVLVYRCAGSHVGQETNAAVWNQVASATVNPAGQHQWSSAFFSTPWTIPAGNHGFAVVAQNLEHRYDNLAPPIPSAFATSELRLTAGSASNVPFAAPVFAGRVPNLEIHYNDPGPGFARATDVGPGCGGKFASFYEVFAQASAFDLSHTSFRLLPQAGGYEVTAGGGVWLPPSAAAVSLGLVDESAATCSFTGVFDYPGGSTSSFEVGSNGTVSADANALDWLTSVEAFLDQPNAVWGVWRDFVPTAIGNVWFEQVGAVVCITFLDVFAIVDYQLDLTPSRFQLQFDTQTDAVTFLFESMSTVGGVLSTGFDCYVVGFSPGGASLDPGPVDLGAAALWHHTASNDLPRLQLSASARPIRNTTVHLSMQPVSATALLGAWVFGFANPQFDLGSLGMPGCTQYVTPLATVLLPLGSTNPPTVPFVVPDAVTSVVFAQSFVFDPAANANALGVLGSQGLRLSIGSF